MTLWPTEFPAGFSLFALYFENKLEKGKLSVLLVPRVYILAILGYEVMGESTFCFIFHHNEKHHLTYVTIPLDKTRAIKHRLKPRKPVLYRSYWALGRRFMVLVYENVLLTDHAWA